MKVIEKNSNFIKRKKNIQNIINERNCLVNASNLYVVNLDYCFEIVSFLIKKILINLKN